MVQAKLLDRRKAHSVALDPAYGFSQNVMACLKRWFGHSFDEYSDRITSRFHEITRSYRVNPPGHVRQDHEDVAVIVAMEHFRCEFSRQFLRFCEGVSKILQNTLGLSINHFRLERLRKFYDRIQKGKVRGIPDLVDVAQYLIQEEFGFGVPRIKIAESF